ncbi:MAG: M23 family metallopeptidase [Anaerolineae bacterium]|nr:M23 family metallopeptidase [Anaerolineae bacterium]MDW8068040.1 M23 family metallopeptidase [Anaerolineae bacterium]
MRYLRDWACALVLWVLLTACAAGGNGGGVPEGDEAPPPESTPPPQSLLIPGETVEGTLEPGETDRWVFAALGDEGSPNLVTVEIWFRPSTASGPEASLKATLVGPDGATLTEQEGPITLPPYIVEQELPRTGSYLLRLEALSGTPGRYTLLVTLSRERYLTRPEVYRGAPPIQWPLDELPSGSSGFIWPSPRRAISGWYFRDPSNPRHVGLDIAAALHDPIFATAAGVVSFADVSGGYGNLIVIDHADGWQSWYAHLSAFSVVVGQPVEQGEIIGAAGSTGRSSGPHLHFELRHNGVPVDPLVYLQ